MRAFLLCDIVLEMEAIKTLTLSQGFDIDILFKNGKIGYTFVFNNQNYGTAIKPQSRKVADIAAACFLLIVNAEETYKELTKK